MRRNLLLAMGALLATPPAALAVLTVNWKMTKRGPQLAEDPPFEHDTHVGGDGPPLRVVWMGDSSVTGAGASSVDASLPRMVARGLDRPVDLMCIAVSGSRVADVVRDQLPQVAALRPDVVLVGIGSNDVLYRTGRRQFLESHRQLFAGMPSDALVVLLGPHDLGACPRIRQPLRTALSWWGRSVGKLAREEAEAHGALYLDMAARVGPDMRRHPDRYYCIDMFHASDDGYRLCADAVLAGIGPALVQREVSPGHR